VNLPANIVSSVRDRVLDRKARRQRDNLIGKIGELIYVQRTDTAISYETEIAALVEEIRHLERTEELRHRSNIADADR
jgi:hypothetical protein